jgi:5'-nucleotidase
LKFISIDPDTNKLIDKYERALIIGTTNVFLNGSHCGVQECNLGNLIADSLVFYRVNYINESLVQTFIKENGNEMLKNEMNEARDVIGLISGESISNSIGRIDNKEYFITKVGLDQVFSNSNSLDMNTIKMYVLNGQTIRHLLEDHLSMFEQNFASNKLLQVSGIKVIYDFSKPSNERLTDILVKCTLCSGENFNKLNDTKFYDVLMPQSIKMKSDINSLEVVSDLRVYDIVEHYIRENSPIATKIEDRITIRERTGNKLSTFC